MDMNYVAGYFDGEGFIGLYWNKGSKDVRYRSGRRGGCWIRAVGINNTYYNVLYDLREEFGGSLRTLREKQGTHKKIYSWTLGSMDGIQAFLDALLPWLREKRPQAETMLACLRGEVTYEDAQRILKDLKHV